MVRFIRFFKAFLLVFTISTSSIAFSRGGGTGGGDFPWPWGLEVPFPFKDVQGVWKVESKNQTYYFGFRRVADKRLLVTQFDATQCESIGSGPGLIRNKSQNYVVSQITMKSTGDVYRMAIYAFVEEDAPMPTEGMDHVVVARIVNLSSKTERELVVQMSRITDRMEFKCLGQNKKLKF